MTESVKNVSSDVEGEDNSDRKSNSGADDPPDGGFHAWLIVIASFLTNGIVFGIHNCYGIIYLRLKSELERTGVNDAALKACKSSSVLVSPGRPSNINADLPFNIFVFFFVFFRTCLYFSSSWVAFYRDDFFRFAAGRNFDRLDWIETDSGPRWCHRHYRDAGLIFRFSPRECSAYNTFQFGLTNCCAHRSKQCT